MERKCKYCNKVFEHGVSANMIIFCPNCKKSTGSISDYGFGPIVPCDIYVGEKIIASIPTMHKLQSTYLDLDRELSGKYADLQIYHEAEAIIASCLERESIR